MSMRALEELREKFCKELDEIARKEDLSAGDLETVHKLTDTIKNIDKICMLDEKGYSDDGYSRDGNWEAHGMYDNRHSGANRRRDSMGRYSRDGSKEHMVSKLEDMMHDADSDKMKSAIRKCISEIERT